MPPPDIKPPPIVMPPVAVNQVQVSVSPPVSVSVTNVPTGGQIPHPSVSGDFHGLPQQVEQVFLGPARIFSGLIRDFQSVVAASHVLTTGPEVATQRPAVTGDTPVHAAEAMAVGSRIVYSTSISQRGSLAPALPQSPGRPAGSPPVVATGAPLSPPVAQQTGAHSQGVRTVAIPPTVPKAVTGSPVGGGRSATIVLSPELQAVVVARNLVTYVNGPLQRGSVLAQVQDIARLWIGFAAQNRGRVIGWEGLDIGVGDVSRFLGNLIGQSFQGQRLSPNRETQQLLAILQAMSSDGVGPNQGKCHTPLNPTIVSRFLRDLSRLCAAQMSQGRQGVSQPGVQNQPTQTQRSAVAPQTTPPATVSPDARVGRQGAMTPAQVVAQQVGHPKSSTQARVLGPGEMLDGRKEIEGKENPRRHYRVSRDEGVDSRKEGRQEGQEGQGGQESEVLAKTLEALREGGFLDSSTDLIRIRPLGQREAMRFLDLLTSMVPKGSDLMDLLATLSSFGIGWSEGKSTVNEVFYRLANHRTRRDRTKADLLLEPIMDVGLLEIADLSPAERRMVRERYEAHVPIAEMYLSKGEGWLRRLGSGWEFLEEELKLAADSLQ